MNQQILPHQRSGYPAFLPYKFYDDPHYAAYYPATAITPTEQAAPNLRWSIERAGEAPAKKTGRGAPRKVRGNSLKPYLQGFNSPGDALRHLPHFDNVVTGAVNADFGSNTRPLSKKLVITLLQRLDLITAEAVQEYMHLTLRRCSERHAQKIAQCLRVIEHAAKTVAETQWPSPGIVNEQGTFTATSYITPCGSETCLICSGSTNQSLDLCVNSTYGIEADSLEEFEDWAVY
jgi:hypothetical protein